MFQQASLINYQRMSKLFRKIRFSYQSDKMLCCKNDKLLNKTKNKKNSLGLRQFLINISFLTIKSVI